jgi:hypothetical protein
MKFEFSWQIFEKALNIKFHENASSGSRVVAGGRTEGQTDRQTDKAKLVVASHYFATALKDVHIYKLWRLQYWVKAAVKYQKDLDIKFEKTSFKEA